MKAFLCLSALALSFFASSQATAADDTRPAVAPAGDADTRYCMRIEAPSGTRIEKIRCWTRTEWERQGVDLDADWPKEGVKVVD